MPWPKERSVHGACAIVDPNLSYDIQCPPEPKLFIFAGANNDGYTINDAWILDVNSITWNQVRVHHCIILLLNFYCMLQSMCVSLAQVTLPSQISKGRMCHSLGAYYQSQCDTAVVIFGGLPGKIEKNAAFTDFTPLEETIVLHFGE